MTGRASRRPAHRARHGPAALVVLLSAGALGAGRLVSGAGFDRSMALAAEPATSLIYLPFAHQRQLPCDAGCRTATAIAIGTVHPTATPTSSPSPSSSATAWPTVTPTASRTPTPTERATPLLRTATHTRTPTTVPSPTPMPTGLPPDPATDRLMPLAARSSQTGRVDYLEDLQAYRFQFAGSPPLTLEVDLTHPDIFNGRLAVRHLQSNRYPLAGAGLYYRSKEGRLLEPRMLRLVGPVPVVSHESLPDGLRLTVQETLEEVVHNKRYTLRMVGRALEVRAESLDPAGLAEGAYAGFGGGDMEGTSDGVSVRIPYMSAVPVTMLDHKWFVSTLLDLPRSQAGQLLTRGPEGEPGGFIHEVSALYPADAAGRVRLVDETVWVTVSRRVEDTFPALPGGASPQRATLAGKVAVTLRGAPRAGSFATEAAALDRLRSYGATDLVVVKDAWQDPATLLPAQAPPSNLAGGAAGFRQLATAAGLLAPSTAYTLTLPGCTGQPNDAYRPGDRVIGADGLPKALTEDVPGARLCGGTRMERFLLAPDSARRVASTELAKLKALGAGASFLPTLAAWNPAWPWPGAEDTVLDQLQPPTHPASLGGVVQAYKELFAALQGTGPVLAEGAGGYWELPFDTFYAGYLDGLLRPLASGSPELPPAAGGLVVPDFELAQVRPRLVPFGMGSYVDFFGSADLTGPLSDSQVDTLRAFTLAYGHAGAWELGDRTEAAVDPITPAEQVKEYFTMRPLQQRYLDAPLLAVRYVAADGSAVDLSTALMRDQDVASPRLELRYAEGLNLWINHGESTWSVLLGAERYDLPYHGWLVAGPGGLLAYSAVFEGRRVDYLWTPDYQLMDGRGRTTFFGNQSATDLKVVFADGRVLEEAPDGSLSLTGP